MDDVDSKGKKMLLYTLVAFMVATFLCEVGGAIISGSGILGFGLRMPRVVVFGLLCYFVFKGSTLARKIMIVLASIIAIMMTFGLMMSLVSGNGFFLTDFILVIAYAATIYMLLKNNDIKDYLANLNQKQ